MKFSATLSRTTRAMIAASTGSPTKAEMTLRSVPVFYLDDSAHQPLIALRFSVCQNFFCGVFSCVDAVSRQFVRVMNVAFVTRLLASSVHQIVEARQRKQCEEQSRQ